MSINNALRMPVTNSPALPMRTTARRGTRAVWALSCLIAVTASPLSATAGGAKNRVRALTHQTASASADGPGSSTIAGTPAGTTTIRIAGTRTPTFTMYKLERPARVVVDIANATLDRSLIGRDAKATWTVGSWSVTQVESHELTNRGRATVRVIVRMARAGSYDVKAQGRDLLVVVTPREAAPPSADSAVAAAEDRAARATAELRGELAEAHSRASTAQRAANDAQRAADDARARARRAAEAEREARTAERAARDKVAASEAELRVLQGARAEAESARREIAKLKAAAAKAQRETRAAAARHEAELLAAEKRATKARAEAEKAIAEARAQAVSAQARAKERVRAAETSINEAKDVLKDAEQRLARAEKARKAAAASRRAARTAKSDVAAREREAAAAEKRLAERRAQAERAEKAAREYVRRAESKKSDDQAASALRKRAEAAARSAEKRRAQAERAAAVAERARAEAERAATAAESRQKNAMAAVRDAEREKKAAESAVSEAEKRRASAERHRQVAEKRRAEAEAAAKEASDRADRARALREREEAAFAEVSRARERAVADQRQVAAATGRLNKARQSAEAAEARLVTTRSGIADAERRLRAMTRRKDASQKEIADLRGEADRLAKERERTQRALKNHERNIKREERALRTLEKTRKSKAEELARMEQSAATARRTREREEKLLAELLKRRANAERALQEAEDKRLAAEAKRKTAEARRKTAEAKRLAAEAGRKAAEDQRLAAEAKARAAAQLAAQRDKANRKSSQKKSAQKKSTPARKPAGKKLAKKSGAKSRAKSKSARRGKSARVEQLSFADRDKVARVVIDIAGESRPRVLSASGQKAILEIPGARLPGDLQRTLDTSRYAGPIESISSYRDPRDPNKTRVVVRLDRPAKSALKRSGSTYYWDFAKTRREVAQAGGQRARSRSGQRGKRARSRTQTSVVVGGYGAASTPITQKTVAQLTRGKKKVYRGTKIDLDFKDADIHNLLRTLADVGGVNIVIPDEIQARVTVRLRRVPWDQALEVILASKGLWYRREGNMYRVALRKTLDAEDEAEAQRLANLVKTEAPEPELFILNYAVAKDVQKRLTPLLSPKGHLEIDERTNSVIINDVRANRRRIVDLLRLLDTQTPQVQIEARIVEARSTFNRDIGVQWGGSALASREGGNATGLIFPNSIGIRGGGEDGQTISTGISPSPSDFAVNLPAAVGSNAGGAIGLALGSVGGNFNLSLRLSALEDSGTVRIISQPKITVVDNQRAEISQGVSIPVSVVSANGTQTQFVPAVLSLVVIPHVSQRDCSVQMNLEIQKNEPDFVNTGARGDPSILRKEAKTTVLVADGETTVIGGIYTRNAGLAFSKVPFFGDLPVFGWLFKRRVESDDRSEILVFVTPRITNKSSLRCE